MPEEKPKLKVHIKRTLAKFDGEYEPGKQPVETITEEWDEEIDNGAYERLQGRGSERDSREHDYSI